MPFLSNLAASNMAGGALLAQSRVQSLNEAFLEKPNGSFAGGFVMLGIVVVAILLSGIAFYFYKKRSERVICDPNKLLDEVARAHGLPFGQRRLLKRLAKAKQLSDPVTLLLDDRLWVLDPAQDTVFCKPRRVAQLKALQRVLFTKSENAPAVPISAISD